MNFSIHIFSPQFSPRLSTGVWRWTLTMIIIIDSLVIIIILSVTLRVMPADLITINSPHGTPHRDLWLSVVCTYQLRVWGRRERERLLSLLPVRTILTLFSPQRRRGSKDAAGDEKSEWERRLDKPSVPLKAIGEPGPPRIVEIQEKYGAVEGGNWK